MERDGDSEIVQMCEEEEILISISNYCKRSGKEWRGGEDGYGYGEIEGEG